MYPRWSPARCVPIADEVRSYAQAKPQALISSCIRLSTAFNPLLREGDS